MVILFCGISRTEDMAEEKNRKESILKHATSILKMAPLIADNRFTPYTSQIVWQTNLGGHGQKDDHTRPYILAKRTYAWL